MNDTAELVGRQVRLTGAFWELTGAFDGPKPGSVHTINGSDVSPTGETWVTFPDPDDGEEWHVVIGGTDALGLGMNGEIVEEEK